jgi:hypothetical protein
MRPLVHAGGGDAWYDIVAILVSWPMVGLAALAVAAWAFHRIEPRLEEIWARRGKTELGGKLRPPIVIGNLDTLPELKDPLQQTAP